MKVKDLIKKLESFDQEAQVYLGSDEELNNLYENVEVSRFKLSENSKAEVVLWGDSLIDEEF